MRRSHDQIMVSATDLLGYMACPHHTSLSLLDLETPIPRAASDDGAELIQAKGDEHEVAYLKGLESSGVSVRRISADGAREDRIRGTIAAMRDGVDVIYQAAFESVPLMGYADFLRRVDRPSELGDYSYEVIDTKLARSPKGKFAIQLCFYSRLLADVQGLYPERAVIVLGDGSEVPLRLADYRYYFEELLGRFLSHIAERPATRAEPCAYCELCPWREHCNAQWEAEDHLAFVAGIQRSQIDKLRSAGIDTLKALAKLPETVKVPNLAPATRDKLHHQARLQFRARSEGAPIVEALPVDSEGQRGFARLPAPSPGDLFFDMEGDPLELDGLEYLFGAYYFDDAGRPRFQAFWGHDREQERQAFQSFMDFVTERLKRYPDAHIYHYAHYEETALKRLMCLHGTCEAQVDDLLRREKLVDLYKVVREAIRISEPSYSIKNLEVFYRGAREGDVKDAGASIVAYEQWRATGDEQILKEIEEYNRIDCESTYQLREWLLAQRPDDLPFRTADVATDDPQEPTAVSELEQRLANYHDSLVAGRDDEDAPLAHLVYQLLDFHRRNDKPAWWGMFSRFEMSEEELIEDVEAIGGLEQDPEAGREPVKRSEIVTYRFPEQELKLKVGDRPKIAETGEPAGEIVALDVDRCVVRLKRGVGKFGPLPEHLSIIPGGPLSQDAQREALFRIADSVALSDERFAAVKALLRRQPPQVKGHTAGEPLLDSGQVTPEAVAEIVAALDDSYLFIQGPPGAGKTYTGSYVIVELIRQGYKVGVTSNSHKAIDNLLSAVEGWAAERGVGFQGLKKASRQNSDSEFDGERIHSAYANGEVTGALDRGVQLIAGTSWLLCDRELEGQLDYLFVDEAGQVALANLVAMGASARNIVLLGDQMQLGQPIQGTHPGRSGESSLEYLLDGHATIAPDRGVFLPDTYRMHPAVTQFISDAIYDGRLKAASGNESQRLPDPKDLDTALRKPGLAVIEVPSDGWGQRNADEAEVIRRQYQTLLGQPYIDRSGKKGVLTEDTILVVAPYNMQVNLLKATLGDKARIGTVDKFQGQEAEVVFISMTTSSQEYLPRFIDFLFSRNRLNVAISRARILAVLVLSPDLTRIECNSLEQMQLVNTLCWAKAYAKGHI